jgi:putative GTP pyrophosphokinase
MVKKMTEHIDEILKNFPNYDSLAEQTGPFGKAKNWYDQVIGTERSYEIDVLRDLQRTVDRARERSQINKELIKLDKHYHPKVVSRVKSLDSVYKKLAEGQITTNDLPLDDIIGYRLVCRFLDEALELRDILDKELNKPPFKITSVFPREESGKWANKEPYSGYRSYDYALLYSRPEIGIELEAELQLRTILQHAWAEVSHDTFYKNSALNLLPEKTREELIQRMHELSNFLEDADNNFVKLRKETTKRTGN